MQLWTQRLRQLKQETYAIYLVCKDPRLPWYARVLASCVVAYAFSPLDLIPDFIPVLGYLDDIIIVPVGIWLVLQMIPPELLADCRQKAAVTMNRDKPTNWIAAGIVVAIWFVCGILAVVGIGRILKR